MPEPKIDYAALAQQARGGGVDYAAMAAQARGEPSPASTVPAGSAPGFTPTMPGPDKTLMVVPPPTPLTRLLGNGAGDAGTVVGQHLKNLIAAPYHAVKDSPHGIAEHTADLLGPAGLPLYRALVKPTTQALGTAVDQAKAGNLGLNTKPDYDAEGNYTPNMLGSLLDAIPVAGPWARGIETDAQQHGGVPAMLGLGTDIVAPKVGGVVASKALNAVAPVLAETALKVRGADRGYGATPGRAILDNTSGLQPSKVVDSARVSLNRLQAEQSNVLGQSQGTVPLKPTRGIGDDYADRGLEENFPGTVNDMRKLNDQLAYRVGNDGAFDTTNPIPNSVRPADAAALNRGLSARRTTFNPLTTSSTVDSAAGEMHHQLAQDIGNVVPEVRPLNQQVQSLIPVVRRATAADLNAGILQNAMAKFTAPTGALIGLIEGYKHFGPMGAAAGTLGPLALASPPALLSAARLSNAIAPIAAASPRAITAMSVTGKKD